MTAFWIRPGGFGTLPKKRDNKEKRETESGSVSQTVDKVGVGIYSQHHFSLYNQYFDSFLKI